MRKLILAILAASFVISLYFLGGYADDENLSKSAELLSRGDDLFNSGEIDEAMAVYVEAAETAELSGANSDFVEACAQVARCYLRQDKKEKGRPWLEKAGKSASEEEPNGWSRYLGVRGRYEWKDAAAAAGEVSPVTEKASATFKQMHDYCLKNELYGRAIDAANMVTITGSMEERVDWGLKGIEAAEKGNHEGWLAPLWNNLGWTYDDLGRYEESLTALEQARKYHYLKGDEMAMLIADWSVGHALRMTGQVDSAETVLKKVQRWTMIIKGENKTPETAEWFGFANLREPGVGGTRAGERELHKSVKSLSGSL
jgi:tetratricopeptide (TPR) repeat protein